MPTHKIEKVSEHELALIVAKLAVESLDQETLEDAQVGLTAHNLLDSPIAKEVCHLLSGSDSLLSIGSLSDIQGEDTPHCFERLMIHGNHLWAESFEGIYIWQLSDRELVYTHDHQPPLDSRTLSISRDGQYFAVAQVKRDFALWNAHSFDRLSVFKGHREEVSAISFLNGERLASCSGDGKLILWNAISAKEVRRIETTPLYCLSQCPIEELIAVGGSLAEGGKVIVANSNTLDIVSETNLEISTQPFPALSDDGARSAGITAGRRDKAVVESLVWHLDGRHLLAGCWDYTIKMVDGLTGAFLREWAGHSHWVDCVLVTPGGRHMLSSGWSDGRVLLWSLDAEVPLAELDLKAKIGDMCISYNRLYVAVGGDIRMFCLPRSVM